ncbi:MAG: putative DNA binding domain-containing protein [Muribaculaceae bacterium]|nr:putative DNA binding domain-containing protein [Muribaculaceae bacterium]
MALAIDIEDLLKKNRVESNRIEYKKGWNPSSIYHTVCAFANDFEDLGGGYIVVGVDTDNDTGLAMRPVVGVPLEQIDGILQEMVGYNNKISPYYMPRTSVEFVDDTQVLVIWCPAGINRPYSVPENVVSKKATKEYFYVRSGTSSVIAKGDILDELRDLANRIPFDEKGNPDIRVEDISTLLLREYLVKVNSKLASELYTKPLAEILEQMDLFVGPSENRMLRNVAAMMFCENPSKFFKRTQIEIVYFPDGRLRNPNNLFEGPIITGSIPQIIERTLEYLNRMLVRQFVAKPKDDFRSRKYFSYPYQALEESVTNSIFHRDYREWEPVVITVEPDGVTIQNVGGPDRSISNADINRCELLVSKRYRNRRLGEFLKELGMTEGRSTGIPTIQNELEANGSPRAVVVTDEDRTFFRITIPCHVAAGNLISDISDKDNTLVKSKRGRKKTAPKTAPKTALKSAPKILAEISANKHITVSELVSKTGYSRRWVLETMKKLQESGKLMRVGPRKGGHWEIVE